MKFSSLLPWYQGNPPRSTGILLYGNSEGLINFRSKSLQNIFVRLGYRVSSSSSSDEAIDKLQESPSLFDTKTSKKCIVLENVTDAFLKKIDINKILQNSSDILILSSNKLTSKSKLVAAFQSTSATTLVPCYEINLAEISFICQRILTQNQIQLDPEALKYLMNCLTTELESFFSIIEIIILYGGATLLTLDQVKNILDDFSSSHIETFNQEFFQGHLSTLENLMKTVELSDWIGILRPLIQDLTTLLSLNSYRVSVHDLRNCWMKGVVKFPYPRLAIYEKILPLWDLKRCGMALTQLLELEKNLKSSPSPFLSQVEYCLINLSRSHGDVCQQAI